MSGLDDILAGYESLRAGQEALYKDLHQHPELSHAEHRTARRVAEQLQDAGFTIASGIGGTGVTGVLAETRAVRRASVRSISASSPTTSPSSGMRGRIWRVGRIASAVRSARTGSVPGPVAR
jgi:hypothetical protein